MIKFREETGKIHDVISYGAIYFYKDAFIKMFERLNIYSDETFDFFYEVKNKCKPLLECVQPFFYYDSLRPCFLLEYFYNNIDYQKAKFNDFINILQDFSKLKKGFFNYMFENLSESDKIKIIDDKDGSTICNFLKNTTLPLEMKNHFLFMLYNFDYAAECLVNNIKETYKHIQKLHEIYKNKINIMIERIMSKEVLILFERVHGTSEIMTNKQCFSICLMNQHIVLNKSSQSFYVLGYKYKKTLEMHFNKKNISIKSALEIFGDRIRLDIIDCLKKHKKLTQSEICRLINTSMANTSRDISILFYEGIIKISHREGRKVYFMLDNEYIELFQKSLINFINELKNNCEEIENEKTRLEQA